MSETSESHIKERQCWLHKEDHLEGVNDIRTYFQRHTCLQTIIQNQVLVVSYMFNLLH